jgi:hypothetical protein
MKQQDEGARVLHLVEPAYRQGRTLCGLSLETVGEDWTDAIFEIVASGLTDSECSKCYKLAEDIIREESAKDDANWKREQALEAGMLHGVDAYNDAMGYGHG